MALVDGEAYERAMTQLNDEREKLGAVATILSLALHGRSNANERSDPLELAGQAYERIRTLERCTDRLLEVAADLERR